MSERLERIRFERPVSGDLSGVAPERGLLVQWPHGSWTMFCPKCAKGADLGGHDKTINADGTVTLNPSLVCPQPGCDAHYFVESNRIRWA